MMVASSVLLLGIGVRSPSEAASQPKLPEPQSPEPIQLTYKVTHVYPHLRSQYTEGLEFHNGYLYETNGREGFSTLCKEELETGRIVQQTLLPSAYFGEGLTVLSRNIFQVTWHSGVGISYDLLSMRQIGSFRYPGEGWGLANDGQFIYMSDGTSEIRCLDPNGFREKRRLVVHDGRTPVTKLNELEWYQGQLLANVWQSNYIVKIDPRNGRVLAWINLSGLLGPKDLPEEADVLNGIAYDITHKRLFVTGKLWPKLFEIEFTANSGHSAYGK